METTAAAINGFFLGGGLIVAIGAQNAYLLRQGLIGRHVPQLALFCALSDALLIALGVAGLGSLISARPTGLTIAAVGGGGFLAAYGALALRRAWRPAALTPAAADAAPSLAAALLTCAAFTFLNPHVYLDTVVLVGGVSARYPAELRPWFAGGAMTASFLWFFSLGFGAR
ncbi:LysE family transporter, partial [bacterium]|nr:LysE family transporter [bacterium]